MGLYTPVLHAEEGGTGERCRVYQPKSSFKYDF